MTHNERQRAEFEAWYRRQYIDSEPLIWVESVQAYREFDHNQIFGAYQAGRAALQSKPIESAAREIALWAYGEVGADPELTPGLAQLLHHFGISDDVPVALQSQDREDAERYRYLRDSAQLYSHFGDIDNSGWCVMRRDHTLRRVFTYNGPDLDEAIDHARRNKDTP